MWVMRGLDCVKVRPLGALSTRLGKVDCGLRRTVTVAAVVPPLGAREVVAIRSFPASGDGVALARC